MKMKQRLKLMMVIAVMILIAGCTSEKTQAAGVVSLKTEKVYRQYDITGNGKRDTLQIKKIGDKDNMFEGIHVYVNDRKVLTEMNWYYELKAKVIRLKNGKDYLFFHFSGDNDDGASGIYEYKNGGLKKCVDLVSVINNMGYHSWADIDRVEDNTVIVDHSSMSYALANVHFESRYQFRNGKLKLQSNSHKVTGYYNGKGKLGIKKLTATKSAILYREKTMKNIKGRMKKGDKLRVMECYISGKMISYYVELENGKSGWYRSPRSCTQPFKEIGYAA